jgi:fumarylacetoacetase
MPQLNETHHPQLTSWVASANDGRTDFPIQNLPFAVFRRKGSAEAWRGGVAIGDQILDMAAAVQAGVFTGDAAEPARAAAEPTLNNLMQIGPQRLSSLR